MWSRRSTITALQYTISIGYRLSHLSSYFFLGLFIFYIAVIISLYYLFLYIIALYSINIYLARDLFNSLKAKTLNIQKDLFTQMQSRRSTITTPQYTISIGYRPFYLLSYFFLDLFIFIFFRLTITILPLQNNALLSL